MKFLVMPGDGIGPEIVPVAVAALEALDRVGSFCSGSDWFCEP